jgi:hypothetical protein
MRRFLGGWIQWVKGCTGDVLHACLCLMSRPEPAAGGMPSGAWRGGTDCRRQRVAAEGLKAAQGGVQAGAATVAVERAAAAAAATA